MAAAQDAQEGEEVAGSPDKDSRSRGDAGRRDRMGPALDARISRLRLFAARSVPRGRRANTKRGTRFAVPERKPPGSGATRRSSPCSIAMRNYPKVIDYANRALKADPTMPEAAGDAGPGLHYLTNDNKNALRVMHEVHGQHRSEGSGPKEQTLHLISRSLRRRVQDNACVDQGVTRSWCSSTRSLSTGRTCYAFAQAGRHQRQAEDQRAAPGRSRGRSQESRRDFTEFAQIALDEGLCRAEAQSVLEQAIREEALQGPAQDRPEQRGCSRRRKPRSRPRRRSCLSRTQRHAATPEGDDDVEGRGCVPMSFGDSARRHRSAPKRRHHAGQAGPGR